MSFYLLRGNDRPLIYFDIIIAAWNIIVSLFTNDNFSILNISNKMILVLESGKHMMQDIKYVSLMNDNL